MRDLKFWILTLSFAALILSGALGRFGVEEGGGIHRTYTHDGFAKQITYLGAVGDFALPALTRVVQIP